MEKLFLHEFPKCVEPWFFRTRAIVREFSLGAVVQRFQSIVRTGNVILCRIGIPSYHRSSLPTIAFTLAVPISTFTVVSILSAAALALPSFLPLVVRSDAIRFLA